MTSAEPTATITWKQGATTGTIALCKASEVRGALMAAGAIVSDDISISVKLGRFARTSLYDLLAKEKLQDDPDPLDPQYELELSEPKEKRLLCVVLAYRPNSISNNQHMLRGFVEPPLSLR